MRALLIPLLFSAATPAFSGGSASQFGSAFYTGLSMSVVQVRVANASGKGFFGSGVVVAGNEVITNCHVTRQAVRIEVAKGALVFPVFGQKVDMANDLCLLRTATLPLRTAALRDTGTVKPGETSFYYGYSGGIEAFFAPGRVATLHPHDGSAVLETSSGFALGGSGGGLFDTDGRLIGVTTFLSSGHSGGYFAMPADLIHRLRNRTESEVAPIEGLALWEGPADRQPWFLRLARLASRAHWQEAAVIGQAWIRAEPSNADAWHQTGIALLHLQRPDEALSALQTAQQIEPDHPDVLFHLALAHARTGAPDAAREMRNRLALADADRAARLDDALGCSAYC